MDICQCSIYSILFINLILIVLIHTLNKKYNYHTSDTISAKLIPNQPAGTDIPGFVSTHCNNINNTAATQPPPEPSYQNIMHKLLLMNKNGKTAVYDISNIHNYFIWLRTQLTDKRDAISQQHTLIRGAKGQTGEPGNQGIHGVKGNRGPQGPKGSSEWCKGCITQNESFQIAVPGKNNISYNRYFAKYNNNRNQGGGLEYGCNVNFGSGGNHNCVNIGRFGFDSHDHDIQALPDTTSHFRSGTNHNLNGHIVNWTLRNA